MQIKMPYLRSIAAEEPLEADEPNHDQSGQRGSASQSSHSEHCQRPSDKAHIWNLLRGCDKTPYEARRSVHRDLVYAPPRAVVQQFIEDAGCPTHLLRITPEGTWYFEAWFRNATLIGKYSDVERFLHALPPQLRRAIERVYCFIDGESPPSALRFYNGRLRQKWCRVNADAWREAEKRRRSATVALTELLDDRVQAVQVFSHMYSFVVALEGITGSGIDVPEFEDEQPEASGAQTAHGRNTEQAAGEWTAGQEHAGHNAEQISKRGEKPVHQVPWQISVENAVHMERESVHRQYYAGQRRKQHIRADPEEEAFQYDQEQYQVW